ncbi:MAG: hypothetical protein COA50_07115 [Flavobacteriaceae bacterium]|nr:MAG: hypothetical protein COA50_07115 [Flavobacteriaceae bacterium]
MKVLGLLLGCLFTTIIATAQEGEGININVTIENITSNEGKVLVSLHSVDTFMKTPGIKSLESSIENGKVSFTFENVPSGTYAIMAIHDANENGTIDFEASGMPKESYGVSGNDMSFGPPTFTGAKFEVTDAELDFDIRF